MVSRIPSLSAQVETGKSVIPGKPVGDTMFPEAQVIYGQYARLARYRIRRRSDRAILLSSTGVTLEFTRPEPALAVVQQLERESTTYYDVEAI